MERFLGDESAASTVIGTILMVLLVLVLVAVLLFWAMSFLDDLPGNPLEDEDEAVRGLPPDTILCADGIRPTQSLISRPELSSHEV